MCSRFPAHIDFNKCRETIASALNDYCPRRCKREHVESNALHNWNSKIFKIIDERVLFYSYNLDLLPPLRKNKTDPTLYWLPKHHKRPYKARFIANSSSCTTTVLSKLLTLCLTAVKNIGLDTMILFTKGTELTIFGQLKIPMKFSINLNLKIFRLLNCLHMIFLHCILRYLIIL